MAMIEAAAIDITMPSPPITASQSQGASILSRPSTNTCLRHLGQRANRARQRPQRGAQDIVAIDPRRRGKGDRKGRGRADLLEQFLAAFGRQPLGIVDAFRDPLRIEHDGGGHHRSRQRTAAGLVATGHRPDAALDQRPLAAKARRRDRDDALGRLGRRLAGFRLLGGLVPNHGRDRAKARAPGATGNPVQFPLFSDTIAATPRPQSGRCTRRSSPTSMPGATTTSQGWLSGSAK